MKLNSRNYIKKIVLIALLSAIITAGKFALMAVPNVEIVTIIIMVSSFVFGLGVALPATIIFVTLETFIWGFSPWVIAYYIYWPLLALITFLVKKLIVKNLVIFPALIAAVMTLLFGVLTTFIDTLFYSGGSSFFSMFAAMYLKGVSFFLIHVVSNSIILALLFLPLSKVLLMLANKYFGTNMKENIKPINTKDNQEAKLENAINKGVDKEDNTFKDNSATINITESDKQDID